jgi:hypothetical protein
MRAYENTAYVTSMPEINKLLCENGHWERRFVELDISLSIHIDRFIGQNRFSSLSNLKFKFESNYS